MGRANRRDVVLAVVALVVLSVAMQVGMAVTAVQGDPFDSPVYLASWLVFPLAAALASAWRPSPTNPLLFTAALVVPMLIGTFRGGAVLYDGSGGASFWLVGEVFNVIQGVLIACVAFLGAGGGYLLRRRRRPAPAPARS